jgi:hypothetical protein
LASNFEINTNLPFLHCYFGVSILFLRKHCVSLNLF